MVKSGANTHPLVESRLRGVVVCVISKIIYDGVCVTTFPCINFESTRGVRRPGSEIDGVKVDDTRSEVLRLHEQFSPCGQRRTFSELGG